MGIIFEGLRDGITDGLFAIHPDRLGNQIRGVLGQRVHKTVIGMEDRVVVKVENR